jgi:hypothetical protein
LRIAAYLARRDTVRRVSSYKVSVGKTTDLTVGHVSVSHSGGLAELRAAGEAVRPLLPIRAEASEVTLMAGPPPERQAPGPPTGTLSDGNRP